FLDDVVIVILFDEWWCCVHPLRRPFGRFEVVVSVCLSEFCHTAWHTVESVCSYKRILIVAFFCTCYIEFCVFTCQCHIILPPEIVRPRRYYLALLLLQSPLPVCRSDNHAPLRLMVSRIPSRCQFRAGSRAAHHTMLACGVHTPSCLA